MIDCSITCIYATARPGKSMIGREVDHISLYLDCLAKQTMPPEEFQVIIPDYIYNRREAHVEKNTYKGVEYPFEIIHFQVKSPWLDRGLWTLMGSWNQATMLATGELLCMFGDCCEPPPTYLERIRKWYDRGYWALGLTIYKRAGELALKDHLAEGWGSMIIEQIKALGNTWDPSNVIRDSRWPFVERSPNGIVKLEGEAGGQQFHGYSSVPLSVVLELNGFDENFEGYKDLEDVELGMRLAWAGYDKVLVLDKNIWLYENAHYPIPEDVVTYRGPPIRSNYRLLMLNREKRRWRANSYSLSEEDVKFISESKEQAANEYFQWWIRNPRIFDLKTLREAVQLNLMEGRVEIPNYGESS